MRDQPIDVDATHLCGQICDLYKMPFWICKVKLLPRFNPQVLVFDLAVDRTL